MVKRKEEPVEEPVKEPEMKAPTKKRSNAWVDEVKALQKKKSISYKEAMKEASLIRKQGKGGKS